MKNSILYILLLVLIGIRCTPKSNEGTDKRLNDLTSFTAEDEKLLDRVQRETFNFYWEGAESDSGAALERIHMDGIYGVHGKSIVTAGGTGFSIMATLVGIERGFITREEGYERLRKLTNWLATSDRYHGAWPHWWNPDGTTYPFSPKDDGGDLVETAFLAQGLITARQYFQNGNEQEHALAKKMDGLWKDIDWQFYTQGEDVLYWHWSPNHNFEMNFAVRGFNECLIMYVLAASSPTHPVTADVYHKGFAVDGAMYEGTELYGIPTILNYYYGNDMAVGPLFWSHYSYLGLNPNGLKIDGVDFGLAAINHAKIHHQHSVQNPYDYRGYSDECWGLTSSYSMKGYSGHNPQEDFGVISPTAALSSFPFTPQESMKFLKYLYKNEDKLVGKYGPYDAFSHQSNWYIQKYLAIDQMPIPVMIENYRTGLLWDLFMSAPEVQNGLDKIGFEYTKPK